MCVRLCIRCCSVRAGVSAAAAHLLLLLRLGVHDRNEIEHCLSPDSRPWAHLLLLLGLGVHDRDELDALALLHDAVHVQDALVARREDGLVLQELQDLRGGAVECYGPGFG